MTEHTDTDRYRAAQLSPNPLYIALTVAEVEHVTGDPAPAELEALLSEFGYSDTDSTEFDSPAVAPYPSAIDHIRAGKVWTAEGYVWPAEIVAGPDIDHDNGTTVSDRGDGYYRAECVCGWKSQTIRSSSAIHSAAMAHGRDGI